MCVCWVTGNEAGVCGSRVEVKADNFRSGDHRSPDLRLRQMVI